LACIALVAGLAVSWGLGSLMVRPNPSAVPDARPPATDLVIRTRDGLGLAATYWPGRHADSPAVLLLHGNGASRAAVADNAAWLASQGYAALTIDFRGHGESPAAPHSFGLYESRDAEAALAWLKQRQHGAKVAVIGISLGGAASLLGERGPIPADALILQAVYPDIRRAIRNRIAAVTASVPARLLEPLLSYQSIPRLGVRPGRLSPLAALRRYPGPVLVIGGAADRYTPPAETRAMFEAAPGRRSLWIAPGTDHAQTSDLRTEAYRGRVLAFLRREIGDSLSPPSAPPRGTSSAAGSASRKPPSPR
jgi:alpha-beta hydrolase superfamily lysophospholipase